MKQSYDKITAMNKTLTNLRKKITHIDRQILKLFHERTKLTEAVGKLKKEWGRPIEDLAYELKKEAEAMHLAEKLGLESATVKKLLKLLTKYAKQVQKKVGTLTQSKKNGKIKQ